jgi:hypothetical protein
MIPIGAILGAASIKYGLTNHLRYVLPIMPFLYLLATCPTVALHSHRSRRLATRVGTCALLLSVVSVAASYPHFLGYFNRASGGTKVGWWHLGDSNVDWGQDLVRLRRWIDEQPVGRRFAVDIHHYVDLHTYLGPRCVPLRDATHVIVDAYTLVHALPGLNADKAQWRIGASLFIFEKGDYIMPCGYKGPAVPGVAIDSGRKKVGQSMDGAFNWCIRAGAPSSTVDAVSVVR